MVSRFHSDLLASFNLCLWVSCVVLAVLGLSVRPMEGFQVKKAVEVTELVMDVSTQELASVAETSAGSDASEANGVSSDPSESVAAEPPPLPQVAPELRTELPQLPEIPAMKAPAPAVAAVVDVAKKLVASAPDKSETRSSPKSVSAATTRSAGGTAGAAKASRGAATTLTFGQGQGRQPAPIYPLRARRALQQGTVMVEFLVAESGEVSSAWLERPCPWPILNEAAVETIRRRWHFESGPVRRYRIPIVFTLE